MGSIVALQLWRKHGTVAVQSRYSRCTVAVQSLYSRGLENKAYFHISIKEQHITDVSFFVDNGNMLCFLSRDCTATVPRLYRDCTAHIIHICYIIVYLYTCNVTAATAKFVLPAASMTPATTTRTTTGTTMLHGPIDALWTYGRASPMVRQ